MKPDMLDALNDDELRGVIARAQELLKTHDREIGIGGSLAAPPLPHHRTCGSAYGGSIG